MSERPLVAVGGVVVHKGHLLLVRRGKDPELGRWSVPGGRVRWGESLAQAVEREVYEETGIAVRCGDIVGWVERMSDTHHFVVLDFFSYLSDGQAELQTRPGESNFDAVAGGDATEARWVALDEVLSLDLVSGLGDFLVVHGVCERPAEG